MKLADAALQRTFTRAQYRLTHLQTALQRLDASFVPVEVPVGLGHVRARLSQLESMYDRLTPTAPTAPTASAVKTTVHEIPTILRVIHEAQKVVTAVRYEENHAKIVHLLRESEAAPATAPTAPTKKPATAIPTLVVHEIQKKHPLLEKVNALLAAPQTPERAIAAIKEEPYCLADVDAATHTTAVCLAAITRNGSAIQFVLGPSGTRADAHLRADYIELAFAAVRTTGTSLQHIHASAFSAYLCLAAVQQTGYALAHVPDEFRSSLVELEAVRQNAGAIAYVRNKTLELYAKSKSASIDCYMTTASELELVQQYQSRRMIRVLLSDGTRTRLYVRKNALLDDIEHYRQNRAAYYRLPDLRVKSVV